MTDLAILLGTNIEILTNFLNKRQLYVRSFGHTQSRVDN